jgi:CRP-like cAMP-binding protein
MTFFDYPSGDVATDAARQAFWPDAPEQDWSDLLRAATIRKLATGETLIAPESADRSLYIVVDGQLEIMAPSGRKWKRVELVGPGNVVGELAFLDPTPRAVLVRSLAESSAAEVSQAAFATLARTRPDLALALALDVGRIVAVRLRVAQSRI